MKVIHFRHLIVGLAMLVVAGLSPALAPRKVADHGPKVNLEVMIPKQFGEWKLQETIDSLMISPDVEARVNKIYDQTLTRNYINGKGERIMLSIAYGSDQSYTTQVHLPELCYGWQGFQIRNMSEDFIDINGVRLPVMKLVAFQGWRVEPIIYWVMIGDLAVRGRLEKGLARFKYGLAGEIPAGIVIRVSTISANESKSFRTEEQFVQDMLGAVPMQYRKVLIGAGS